MYILCTIEFQSVYFMYMYIPAFVCFTLHIMPAVLFITRLFYDFQTYVALRLQYTKQGRS